MQANAEKRSPSGSPRNTPRATNNGVPRRSRKSVTSSEGASARKRSVTQPPQVVEPKVVIVDEVQEKFKQLWKVKTIEQGMVRVPSNMLEDLINKDSIGSIFDLEEKPVAR